MTLTDAEIVAAAAANTEPDRFLTILEACAYAHVTRRTIYNWLGKGKLTAYRSAGGMVRVDRAELVRRESTTP